MLCVIMLSAKACLALVTCTDTLCECVSAWFSVVCSCRGSVSGAVSNLVVFFGVRIAYMFTIEDTICTVFVFIILYYTCILNHKIY